MNTDINEINAQNVFYVFKNDFDEIMFSKCFYGLSLEVLAGIVQVEDECPSCVSD